MIGKVCGFIGGFILFLVIGGEEDGIMVNVTLGGEVECMRK